MKAGEDNQRQLNGSGTPSTKFAASWSAGEEIAKACINADNDFNVDFWGESNIVDIPGLCEGAGPFGSNDDAIILQISSLGKIKIPQKQDILATLSSQIEILTVNQATSKKRAEDPYFGNIGGTYSFAGVTVEMIAEASDGTVTKCHPGKITMASRAVELKNVIGGEVTYEDCTEDGVCVSKVADTELESSIGLAMDTSGAYSFQFLCVDMDSDVYDVYAKFSLSAAVADQCDLYEGDCADIADFAAARVALKNRMLTAQQVRMANQIDLS